MEYAAIAMGVFSFAGGLFGASEQKQIEKERARLTYKDNLEKIRRRDFEMEATKGTAKAFSENAGVLHTPGSTPQGFMDTMSSEFKKELDWMKEYAVKARELGMDAASANFKANMFGALTGGVQAGMSVYGAGK